MNPSKNILVFGARSEVGSYLLPLLAQTGNSIYAFSRCESSPSDKQPVFWVRASDFRNGSSMRDVEIPTVISLMPIWELPGYRDILESVRANNLVAFSSTSILSKEFSSNARERHIASLLQRGENWIHDEFSSQRRRGLIFRPTMIYGGEKNQNINRIKRIIKLMRFFILASNGEGLRQPVHAEDLAQLCCQCLENHRPSIRTMNLTGGETLQYRTMIDRIFLSVGVPTRIISMPHYLIRPLVQVLRYLPNYHDITFEMLLRMNRDLCYDDQEAIDEFGWSPRTFQP